MKKLNTKELIKSAEIFCNQESGKYRKELFGVTDGKAVGTFVEHLFQQLCLRFLLLILQFLQVLVLYHNKPLNSVLL